MLLPDRLKARWDFAFDIITVMDVFEHLTDPVAAVDRLAAALTPGGYIFGRYQAFQKT